MVAKTYQWLRDGDACAMSSSIAGRSPFEKVGKVSAAKGSARARKGGRVGQAASRLRGDAASLPDSFEEDKTLPAAWRRAGSDYRLDAYSLKVIVPAYSVKTGLTSGSIS